MFVNKDLRWQILLGLVLVGVSAILYGGHYLLFQDAHHIFLYLVGDIAFLPIEVLFVTLIIHRLLDSREKKERLEKLNMVIGVFFSEVGTELLAFFSDRDPSLEQIRTDLIPTNEWSRQEFQKITQRLQAYPCQVKVMHVDMEVLRDFLHSKRDMLLQLMGNANLLEHESFTDMLWAVFHLTEELIHREEIRCLPETDCEHIASDIQRAYRLLVEEWLSYMHHLQGNYPHLFSLATRLNPFDRNASLLIL